MGYAIRSMEFRAKIREMNALFKHKSITWAGDSNTEIRVYIQKTPVPYFRKKWEQETKAWLFETCIGDRMWQHVEGQTNWWATHGKLSYTQARHQAEHQAEHRKNLARFNYDAVSSRLAATSQPPPLPLHQAGAELSPWSISESINPMIRGPIGIV